MVSLLLLVALLLSLVLTASNDSDFLNWADIEGKQKIVYSNASVVDLLTGQAFYVSGKSVSAAKSAPVAAIVSANVNITDSDLITSALKYKPSAQDVKKAKINAAAEKANVVKDKSKRKSNSWNSTNSSHPVVLSLPELRKKFISHDVSNKN